MSILIDENTRLMIQGMTGKQGRYHTKATIESGTVVCAGVTPGKGGETVENIPVYNTVAEALEKHPEINASMILVPPRAVLSSACEAIKAKIPLIVIVTEFVPVQDSVKIMQAAKKAGVRVIGPNTAGIISPEKSKIGIMPSYIYSKGHVGVISRSGTLMHENSSNMTFAGYGQTTCIGVGGDPVIGISQKQALEMFRDDNETDVVVIIGEIGGTGEEEAAEYMLETNYPKPVIVFIAGATAPEGKKMGHAGAIVSNGKGSAKSKLSAFEKAGAIIAQTVGEVISLLSKENEKLGGKLMTQPVLNKNG